MMKLGPWEIGAWVAIGLIGHALFFTRFYIQWIVSERKKESVVPVSFWLCSIGGSLLVLYYSIHRQDPVFIVGMAISFLIASRNLILIFRKPFYKHPLVLVAGALVLISFYPVYKYGAPSGKGFVLLGFIGQAIFTARFVIQWIVSEKKNKSVMPVSFWYCSLIGGTIRLIYAIYRKDFVFILAGAVGIIPYFRNLVLIYRKQHAADEKIAAPETIESNSTL
jgi:lipid-A-disaccharide synthase-like uncharacterized protein